MKVTVDFDDDRQVVHFLTGTMKNEINNGHVLHLSVQHPDHGDLIRCGVSEAPKTFKINKEATE